MLRCFVIIVVMQSQTLVRKATVVLCKTEIVFMDKNAMAELVLDPQSKFASIFVCVPRSSVTPRSHNLSSSFP